MSTNKVRVKVQVSDLKPGKKVFVTPTSDVKYLVLDVGHPFILLENLKSHWAGFYHPVDGVLYADFEGVGEPIPVETPSTEETPSKYDEFNPDKPEETPSKYDEFNPDKP